MMLCSIFLNLICLVLGASTGGKTNEYVSGNNRDQAAALEFLQDFDNQYLKHFNKVVIAKWNYETNLTEFNLETMLKMNQAFTNFVKEGQKKASSFAWTDLQDTNKTAYAMFKEIVSDITPDLAVEKLIEIERLKADMKYIRINAKVCSFSASSDNPCELPSEPESNENCETSREYKELAHTWTEYHNVKGRIMRDKFIRYVELSNEAAELEGFNDMGEKWRDNYKSDSFREDMEELTKTLQPFYEQLHAYVRQKLRKQYPCSGIKADGPIPAHILGFHTGEAWHIFDKVLPYPGKESTDVTKMMEKKNMTQLDMMKLTQDFFTSLGLMEMTPEFWHRSIFVKPNDREIDCHPSAGDFYDGKDFRISMCADVDMEDLIIMHHEMGHIEYFMHYAQQPAMYRMGANPAFHEAIGDTIALSVTTPEHLKKIGLLEEVFDDKEADINSLLQTALKKVPFMAFGHMIDAWRWKVFDGSISKEEFNQKWWEMKLQYQGVCPPVRRTNEDLDALALAHVVGDITYIRYFIAYIIQFQFHKALCDVAGHHGPLHKCDIYNNKKAGKVLSDMMKKGSSEPWEEAMSAITSGKSRKIDATGVIEYFAPLIDWLKEQNKNETLGWKSSDPMICP